MFSTVLQELKANLGRDFLFSAFFPVLFFVGTSIALFIEITRGLGASLDAWVKLPAQIQALYILSGLIIVIFLAYLIRNFQYVINRLFEGYWSRIPILAGLRKFRVKLYKKHWEYLDALARSTSTLQEAIEIIAEQLAFYPPPNHLDKLMPTRIGNILRAAEIYAYDRYGIDSTIIWTRLRPLLKTEAIEPLEDKKTTLDSMLLMSFLATIFTIVWCPVLAIYTDRWDLFLLCAFGLPLAWICYQTAVQSALAYGEQIKATFDLYRNDLLKTLNRPIPSDADAERKEWLRLTRFFYRNLPLPISSTVSDKLESRDRLIDTEAD